MRQKNRQLHTCTQTQGTHAEGRYCHFLKFYIQVDMDLPLQLLICKARRPSVQPGNCNSPLPPL